MPIQQLNLWDNESLETGYQLLSNLELEEAELQFKKALDGAFGDAADTLMAIEACREWRSMINSIPEAEMKDDRSRQIEAFLSNFRDYPFTPLMEKFRKALLFHIVSLVQEMDQMNLKTIETAFDLLMEIQDYEKGKSLMEAAINQYPAHPELNFMLAQAEWLNGETSKANEAYTRLLLYYPDRVVSERIEGEALRALIDKYGAAMAPAYGWIQKIVPFVLPLDEIEVSSKEHSDAIECYRLIFSATKSMRNRDMKSSTKYRKKLRELSPELFEEYMKWVRHQNR